jgi:hypothetical protein
MKEDTFIGLAIIGTIVAALGIGIGNNYEQFKRRERALTDENKSLVTRVMKKVAGEDEIIAPEESKEFLKQIEYIGNFPAFEKDLDRFKLRANASGAELTVGNDVFYISRDNLTKYIQETSP